MPSGIPGFLILITGPAVVGIQEHEHNTLMAEDKYEDTETWKRYLIDMGYERNFTDGETIIQTNDWSFAPPSGYRDMKNISITNN